MRQSVPNRPQPDKREKIKAVDARKDLEAEVAAHYEPNPDFAPYLDRLNSEQRQEYELLENRDRADIDAFETFVQNAFASSSEAVLQSQLEEAYDRLRQSGPDALPGVWRYVQEINNPSQYGIF